MRAERYSLTKMDGDCQIIIWLLRAQGRQQGGLKEQGVRHVWKQKIS